MEYLWNDGGRAACGFVGLTGDCVARSIAIATNIRYRDVYDQLSEASNKSPRNGVRVDIASQFLSEHRWTEHQAQLHPFLAQFIPKGTVIVYLVKKTGRGGHFCTVVDHVIHDTWNPADDNDYAIACYWTPDPQSVTSSPSNPVAQPDSVSDLTQDEFEKILRRLRALDKTANNSGSTEAEKHNALRMMQSLMLRNNLTRNDITDEDNCDQVLFTRIACPVNGRKACEWEKRLAFYVTDHIIPSTQWFISTRSHRTLFWFYGPLGDVRNAVSLFRELLLTIATSAQLQFGGHTRGSGASYAEGYVQGLPRADSQTAAAQTLDSSDAKEHALIQNRTLSLQSLARDWLRIECDISLTASHGSSRNQHDPNAANRGRLHGSQHVVTVPNAPLRIGKK
jgi:hypothetical protein